ncbi:PID-CTERM protein-sorting domain-containing protein [Hymenobacter bucti]|uniref:PID-CTERM protein-sorting domain-containing protein n=1 Tax=Hymenobacter bucti TaxID=1844114 RepID=A0ABW4QRZ4_9BACT
MKKYAFLFFLGSALVCVVLAPTPVLAQASTGGPTPSPVPDPAAVPLDGGASLLLASGVAFGLRKLRARYKAR